MGAKRGRNCQGGKSERSGLPPRAPTPPPEPPRTAHLDDIVSLAPGANTAMTRTIRILMDSRKRPLPCHITPRSCICHLHMLGHHHALCVLADPFTTRFHRLPHSHHIPILRHLHK